jgi:signal transduction histidine kinase
VTTALDRSLQTGLAVFRLAALAWFGVVTVVERDDLSRPVLATTLVAVTAAWSLAAAVLRRPVPVVDLALSVLLLAADRHVYEVDHRQTFGGAWPLTGALAAGIAWGPAGGAAAGAALGLARWAGSDGGTAAISLVSSGVLSVLAGAVAGDVAGRLRRAESAVAAARAREEVARTLHDGVLQTLAVVQRRSSDPELASLARDQERELRAWIVGAADAEPADLRSALRRCADRVERVHDLRADVVVAEDVPPLPPPTLAALAGAVGEALTNAAKHGAASHVTVYAEPADDDGVFVSVKDDGRGFEAGAAVEGVGTARSIRGRVVEVGGRVEIDGNPGHGTEVRLWVPA